jgi:hypothetical protein
LGFTLNESNVYYSRAELLLFRHIPKNGSKVTTSDLASRIHGKARHGRVRIVSALNSLMYKTRVNREPFRIRKDARNGPHPIGIWLERK